MPQRLHRTRKVRNFTPRGAVYVGRPTVYGNPFAGRRRIGHARSVILHAAWIRGETDAYVLGRAGFEPAEVAALGRWRERLLPRLPLLRGRDLQCWCPLTAPWCHADTLLRIANP